MEKPLSGIAEFRYDFPGIEWTTELPTTPGMYQCSSLERGIQYWILFVDDDESSVYINYVSIWRIRSAERVKEKLEIKWWLGPIPYARPPEHIYKPRQTTQYFRLPDDEYQFFGGRWVKIVKYY